MSNELMIPEASEVPAHIRDPKLAAEGNADAAAGISTGFPARVKLSGKQFTLVDGNGEETPFPPAKLVGGEDGNVYMPAIILRAKKALTKSWYAQAYNPAAEGVGPDCFSNDSERPDPSSPVAQADTCAACPNNAWGSGTDQNGNATKGKACSDTKLLAAFVPGFGVHSFKLPPASLKNFGLYVKQLSGAGIPLGSVKTLIGFDLTETFPILVFRFGGYIPENFMPKLAEMAASSEAEDAIGGITASSPAAPALPAPEKPTPAEVAADIAKEAANKAAIDTAAAPAQATVADDLGLGLDTPAPPQAAPTAQTTAPVDQSVSDQQLRDELGL